MSSPGPLRPLVLLALAGSLHAAGDGWLGIGSRPAPAPGPAGLTALEPELVPYVHPFDGRTRTAMAGRPAPSLDASRTYLLRGRPGAPDPRANRAFLAHQIQEAQRAGFRFLGAVPRGGVPFTPLVGVATYEVPSTPVATPFLDAIATDGGRVLVSILSLPAEGQDPKELILFGSPTLPPAQLLELAARTHAELATTWFPGPMVTRADLAAKFAGAIGPLDGHDDAGLIVAVRVLWDTAAGPIPGVGGVLVKAVDPSQAFPRLYALYEGARR